MRHRVSTLNPKSSAMTRTDSTRTCTTLSGATDQETVNVRLAMADPLSPI